MIHLLSITFPEYHCAACDKLTNLFTSNKANKPLNNVIIIYTFKQNNRKDTRLALMRK